MGARGSMGLSKKEAKKARKSSKEHHKAMIDHAYAQETGWDAGAQNIGRAEKLKMLQESQKTKNSAFTRLQTPIACCTGWFALWWIYIVVNLPVDAAVRMMLLAASVPAIVVLSTFVSYLMKRRRRDNRGQDSYQQLPLVMYPPILLFITLMVAQFVFRLATVLDKGAIYAAISEDKMPAMLDISMLVVIPTVFALFVIMMALIIVPTLAAEEGMLGFNELNQYMAYIVVGVLYTMFYTARQAYLYSQ